MHVTFRQLQVLEAVARHLNLTRAAEELHLSQPAVSMQVKQLERGVGLPLIEQLGKRVHLTQAGEVILRCGRTIAQELRDAEQAIEELRGVDSGSLSVTVATTVNYFASRLLAGFCREHRNVRVSLNVTNREAVIRVLNDNATDIALMGRPPRGLDVIAEPFMENPLVVIGPPGHELAGRRRIPLSALEQETFLFREEGSGTRLAMERFFSERGIKPLAGVEMTSNEAIKQAVEAGLGLGVVSRHTIELELDAARLVVLNVSHFPIRRRWYIAHRRGKRLSATAIAFRDFVLGEKISSRRSR